MWHGQDQSEMNFGGISKEAIRGWSVVKALIIWKLSGSVIAEITAFPSALFSAIVCGLTLTLGLRRSCRQDEKSSR